MAARAHFDLGVPALQRFDELVALTLEIGRDLAQALLESLPAALTELLHSFAEDLLGFAQEHGHGTVELAGEAPGGLLPRLLDRRVELERRRLREAARLTAYRALELLDLAPLDVGEGILQTTRGLRLLPLDLLAQLPLTPPKSLGDLVQRPSPLGRMTLQLALGRLDGCARGL